jgi:hypothetical protein
MVHYLCPIYVDVILCVHDSVCMYVCVSVRIASNAIPLLMIYLAFSRSEDDSDEIKSSSLTSQQIPNFKEVSAK